MLMPMVLATGDGSTASTLTTFESHRYLPGQISHDRNHRRKVKVTVEKDVDDDSTNGYNTKTVTVERNVDDDSTDGSTTGKTSSHTKTKASVSSPYAIPSDISAAAASTTTTAATASATAEKSSSNRKHHPNSTATDDVISGDHDDDASPSNGTTPIGDMMDVLNANMDQDANETGTNGFGGKIVLPPEHEPSETWIVAMVTLFSSMAISLCITTAIRRWRKNQRRTGYQEVNNIVV